MIRGSEIWDLIAAVEENLICETVQEEKLQNTFEKLRPTGTALKSNYIKSVRMFLRKIFYEKKTQSLSVVNFHTLEKSIICYGSEVIFI